MKEYFEVELLNIALNTSVIFNILLPKSKLIKDTSTNIIIFIVNINVFLLFTYSTSFHFFIS